MKAIGGEIGLPNCRLTQLLPFGLLYLESFVIFEFQATTLVNHLLVQFVGKLCLGLLFQNCLSFSWLLYAFEIAFSFLIEVVEDAGTAPARTSPLLYLYN